MRSLLFTCALLLPVVGNTAEPLILPNEDGNAQTKRFIPLDGAANKNPESQKGVSIVREKKFIPLRTDKGSLDKGKLLSDRVQAGRVSPMIVAAPELPAETASKSPEPAHGVKLTHELEAESDGIEGDTETINPVLALFGESGDAPAGTFSEVMSGRGAASIAGLVRHAIWPVPLAAKQYVSSLYGVRNDPFHGRPTFHGGIDIAADKGTAVVATAAGEVVEVKEDNRFGKYVGIKHDDGLLSRYGHLSSQSVSVGQRVRAGQLIGAVGSTGRSTGAHLDYRVSKNGVKYDPLAVISVPSHVAIKAPRPSARPSVFANSRPSSRPSVFDETNRKSPRVSVFRGNNAASNPTPKRPMVIKVQ